ncbi:hypothetical protein ACKUSY_05655 [Myroides odoratus]
MFDFESLDSKLNFGKYKNSSLRWVVNNDPDYLIWAIENVDEFYYYIGYLSDDLFDESYEFDELCSKHKIVFNFEKIDNYFENERQFENDQKEYQKEYRDAMRGYYDYYEGNFDID